MPRNVRPPLGFIKGESIVRAIELQGGVGSFPTLAEWVKIDIHSRLPQSFMVRIQCDEGLKIGVLIFN
jgi:hypothetical protein